MLSIQFVYLERFSIEYRKTKTNVLTLVVYTGSADNQVNQSKHKQIRAVGTNLALHKTMMRCGNLIG